MKYNSCLYRSQNCEITSFVSFTNFFFVTTYSRTLTISTYFSGSFFLFQNHKTKVDQDLSPRDDKFKKFIEYDKKILRFKGYWDDRKTQFGYLHLLQVRYFLSDDTLEVVEMPEYADEIGRYTLLKKIKLPKVIKKA